MGVIKDAFLEERLTAYDRWLAKGLISFSSKVVPQVTAFDPKQWVLPGARARQILETAGSLAVQRCACRSHYQRCDHPLEVCLLMNRVADKAVAGNTARPVTLDEAEEILTQAEDSGLIHLCLYMPDHQVFALCSCCACCCHDLQLVMRYGRNDLLVRSEYRAVTDEAACRLCGACVAGCVFGARLLDKGRLVFKAEKCLGCGLCVPVCPGGAISMAQVQGA